eukprot:TRINITY_DN28814_c0_g1_i1.p1 TRINITY_DN28814_c0_g1~~TRINITY_DN28814_c0_g1_i1.p1  ORF type:complete len:111 (-),score=15.66 TRINITY_DN28814_c0_g1_i1:18-350(-)
MKCYYAGFTISSLLMYLFISCCLADNVFSSDPMASDFGWKNLKLVSRNGEATGEYQKPLKICLHPMGDYLWLVDYEQNRVQLVRGNDPECEAYSSQIFANAVAELKAKKT